MADYWKSQPRKFCQYCKCWIADNKPSIEFHERGKNHKENVAAKIAEIKKKSVEKAKQEKRMTKEFAAMEEAALKAYQEDLKRMGMESVSGAGSCQTGSYQSLVQVQPATPWQPPVQPQIKKHPKKKDKSKRVTREKKEVQTWVEGKADDGNTYYYNTITGESQWERPEGFKGGILDSAVPGTNESFTGSAWVEGISPDGYTYYYNTETGESSWKKPEDFLSSEGSGSGEEVKNLEETSTAQPLSGTEESPSDVQTTPQAESTEQPSQPNFPKINFRKRKSEDTPSENEGEVKPVNTLSHENVEEKKEENVQLATTEPEKKTEVETKRAEAQTTNTQPIQKKKMTQAKRPKGANPYGSWEQIQEEEDPYSKVDLQLPQMEGDALAASIDLPPEPKPKFKERIITSLGLEGGSTLFKKTKTQNGKSRSLRQRDDDD